MGEGTGATGEGTEAKGAGTKDEPEEIDIGPLPWELSEGTGEAAGTVGEPTGKESFVLKDILTRQTVIDGNKIGIRGIATRLRSLWAG